MKTSLICILFIAIFLAIFPIICFFFMNIADFLLDCFLAYVNYIDYFFDELYISRGIAIFTIFLIIFFSAIGLSIYIDLHEDKSK